MDGPKRHVQVSAKITCGHSSCISFTGEVHHEKKTTKTLNRRIKFACLEKGREPYLTSLFLQAQYHTHRMDRVHTRESVANFADPKAAARGREPGSEAATRSREGLWAPGGGRRGRGFVRQLGACRARAGSGGPGLPPHTGLAAAGAPGPRCPTSRTRARGPRAGALETPHLGEARVPLPPREQASM